jgi:hypothetical protein
MPEERCFQSVVRFTQVVHRITDTTKNYETKLIKMYEQVVQKCLKGKNHKFQDLSNFQMGRERGDKNFGERCPK